MNHSLTSASGTTHLKIAALAILASLVFIAVVAAAGTGRSEGAAQGYGPVVKASTLTSIAKTGTSTVR